MEPKILTIPGFLDPETCREVRRAMDTGTADPAEVLGQRIDQGIAVDDTVRRASSVEIDPAIRQDLEARLETARTRVEQFYGVTLGAREGASVLRYGPGGFYRPHRDRGRSPEWPHAARRRIALVVFLNSSREAGPEGDFWGGALRLDADAYIRDVHPEAGALVAFPATTLHEVTTVRDGVRDTVVDWFYERDRTAVSASMLR